jgi:molybdenum cofactor guanylyltransferase
LAVIPYIVYGELLPENIIFFPMLNMITGVILAGGRATRMGGHDKGLVQIKDKYLIEYVLHRLRPQVSQLLISANRNQSQYAKISSCPIIADSFDNYQGPLAGMASTLAQAETDYVLFVPCDAPLLSSQLAARLYGHLMQTQADASVAYDGKRLQPTFCLLKRRLLDNLLVFLKTEKRSIHSFLRQQALVSVDCADIAETFLNINTPEDINILCQ